jgi:iron complex outermembrane receptor protein
MPIIHARQVFLTVRFSTGGYFVNPKFYFCARFAARTPEICGIHFPRLSPLESTLAHSSLPLREHFQKLHLRQFCVLRSRIFGNPAIKHSNHFNTTFMNINAITLLIGFCFFSATALAQQATLSGIITEAKTNSPLIAASVATGSTGTISELNGAYRLSLDPGAYEITFSYVGYETKTEKVTLAAGECRTLDVSLAETSNILQTATVTSGKFEKALAEVTVSIDVIKPQLLESTNQTSLDGLLEKVPGVTFVGDQANIRGGSGFSYGAGSRVLLLVDDIPILQADAGFPQWEDVPLENVEQVEVVKGAASALYGSSALNGIINVRTAYAKSKPETKISPYFTWFMSPKNKNAKWWGDGLDDLRYTTGGFISHKRKIGKLDLVAGGSYYRNNSVRQENFSRRGRWNISGRYRITDRLSVGVNTNFNKSKGGSYFYWAGLDSLLYRPTVSTVSSSNNLRFNIDPYLTWFDGSNNRHRLQGRFYSIKNTTGTDEADQSNRSDLYYGEYQFQRRMERIGLVATAGLVYTGTAVRAPLYGDTTFTSRNFAGYLQMEKQAWKRLNLSAGFRFEHNTVLTPEVIDFQRIVNGSPISFIDTVPGGKIEESRPVFRFGASYAVTPTTFVRASWGQGYRFPTIAEKFIFTSFGGFPINPNLNLNSETGWSAELGLRKGFRISRFSAFLDLAGFISEYQDMMEFTFDPVSFGFQSQNVGDTRIKGFEASITGRGEFFGLETTLLTGYTYIDPKFKTFGLDLPKDSEGYRNAVNSSVCNDPADPNRENCRNVLKYRNRHTFKLDLETTYKKKVSLGIAAIYSSFMENIDAIFEAPFVVPGLYTFRKTHDNGDIDWSLRTAYRFSEKAKASLLINNLFNREYSTRPGLLESPRHVTVRMDFSF